MLSNNGYHFLLILIHPVYVIPFLMYPSKMTVVVNYVLSGGRIYNVDVLNYTNFPVYVRVGCHIFSQGFFSSSTIWSWYFSLVEINQIPSCKFYHKNQQRCLFCIAVYGFKQRKYWGKRLWWGLVCMPGWWLQWVSFLKYFILVSLK